MIIPLKGETRYTVQDSFVDVNNFMD